MARYSFRIKPSAVREIEAIPQKIFVSGTSSEFDSWPMRRDRLVAKSYPVQISTSFARDSTGSSTPYKDEELIAFVVKVGYRSTVYR